MRIYAYVNAMSTKAHYLEDFTPGQVFGGASRMRVELERVKSLAASSTRTVSLARGGARHDLPRPCGKRLAHRRDPMRLLLASELQPAGGSSVLASTNCAGRAGASQRRAGVQSEILEARPLKSRN